MAGWARLAALLSLLSLVGAVRLKSRLGELEGTRRTTPRTGKPYFAFTAVPFARPPVGPLRFKNPVQHEGWEGVLNATEMPPYCIQKQVFVITMPTDIFGEEDCLYLNIFTPSIDSSKMLPVLVDIHGGALRCGGAVGYGDSPSNFMEEDVVLVAIQYRLGVLGFLSTEDSEIPGNFGLKDQAMAIKWIYENIDAFGGDPTSITVMGGSAGGVSAHYLITSPLSRNYLKGAIVQSGTVDAEWTVSPPGLARERAGRIAELMGCDINKNLLPCLQGKEAAQMQEAELNFTVWDIDPVVIFRPVIESDSDGAFITENPRKAALTTPLLTGVVTGEGIFRTAGLYNRNKSVIEMFFEDIDNIIPPVAFVELGNPNLPNFVSLVKEKYFKDVFRHQDKIKALEKFYRDILFIYPMYQSVKRHQGPRYSYVFDYKAQNTVASMFGEKEYKSDEPCHGDEYFLLMNHTLPNPASAEDKQISILLTKLWTNFVKYQNPTPEGFEFNWREFGDDNVFYISKTEKRNIPWPYEEVVKFWDKAYGLLDQASTHSQILKNREEL